MATKVVLNESRIEYPHQYPREYKPNNRKILPWVWKKKEGLTKIKFICIPDTYNTKADIIEYDSNLECRLYILSSHHLDENVLKKLDDIYGSASYPIYNENNLLTEKINELQSFNFYANENKPTTNTEYVEYKLFSQRHHLTRLHYDFKKNKLAKLHLPSNSALLVIVMPENFIKTGDYKGYFVFEKNIIVKVYSNYLLSAKIISLDINQVTDLNSLSNETKLKIIDFFSKLNFIKFEQNKKQIIISDKYLKLVVGELNNLIIFKNV